MVARTVFVGFFGTARVVVVTVLRAAVALTDRAGFAVLAGAPRAGLDALVPAALAVVLVVLAVLTGLTLLVALPVRDAFAGGLVVRAALAGALRAATALAGAVFLAGAFTAVRFTGLPAAVRGALVAATYAFSILRASDGRGRASPFVGRAEYRRFGRTAMRAAASSL